MSPDEITVISVQEIACDEETEDNTTQERKFTLKEVGKAIGISIFGIVALTVLFSIPWTTTPRTDSIIYQSHWMEVLLPISINFLLVAGTRFLQLITWTKEKTLASSWNYLKIYLLDLITWILLYMSAYLIWSIYLQLNHPLPNLGLMIVPTWTISIIGLWIILPSHLLGKKDFRHKLKNYMLYYLWFQITIILRECLSYLYANVQVEFQFLVPFMVAGCRDLDKRVLSKLVTKMMGVQDEAATALVVTAVASGYSFFMSIRLVGAEFATLCCTIFIDFFLHLRMTIRIIKEIRKVSATGNEIRNQKTDMNVTTLVITELIEGFTPIIYMICTSMAYYGPNAHILSNIGNNYWSEEIKNIVPLFVTMTILFVVDTLSIILNAFCLWKVVKINILPEFYRTISKYWYFMTINLGYVMNVYFSTTDINLGMDQTQSFQWITNEGWINLVNTSTYLSSQEKTELISKVILH